MTIELLRTAKRVPYTYRELSAKTGLPVTVLSRYAKGHVLPNAERAHQLWRTLTKLVGLQAELRRRIHFNSDGYFNNKVNLDLQFANVVQYSGCIACWGLKVACRRAAGRSVK
jgi:hypothetical protein